MKTEKPEVRYEDSAELRTGLSGWCCSTCNRYWGGDEHMARYCCATSLPCECGGRVEKGWTCCAACRQRKADERWAKMLETAVDWDGETPLCLYDDDKFFFGVEGIENYLEKLEDDADDEDSVTTIDDLRLVLCEADRGPRFEMEDYLFDSLPDDDHGGRSLDTREIDKAVNDWIQKHAPFCWHPTGRAVTPESVREAFNT